MPAFEAAERARCDIAEARRLWDELKSKLDARRPVFLDETWLKTTMMRLYCLAPRGQRATGRSPHSHCQTTTFLAGLRHDRIVAPPVLNSPMGSVTFRAWVERFLAPALTPGDIVLAVNLASHKLAGVCAAIEARGASMMFLPAFPESQSDRAPVCQDQGGDPTIGPALTPGVVRSCWLRLR